MGTFSAGFVTLPDGFATVFDASVASAVEVKPDLARGTVFDVDLVLLVRPDRRHSFGLLCLQDV